METEDLKSYYANLLIIQYHDKPKAIATIKMLVGPIIMDQLPNQIQNAYEIDTAVGAQLDVLAKYAGVKRAGNGFDGRAINLGDSDFRSLIKMGIIRNMNGTSLSDIDNLLYIAFGTDIVAFDNLNMQMSYFMTETAGSTDLAEMFLTQDLFPRPMGVSLASLIYLASINGLFGFRTYEAAAPDTVSPFNTYEDYQETWPWLTYEDAVIF